MQYMEFIALLGKRSTVPSETYYHAIIEPAYNRSNLEKQEWVKQWDEFGGSSAYCFFEGYTTEAARKASEELDKARNEYVHKCVEVLVNDGELALARLVVDSIGEKEYFLTALKAGKLDARQQSVLYKLLNAEEK